MGRTLHRYFCVVGPRRDAEGYWPGIAYRYLVALRAAELKVRAISASGGVTLQAGEMNRDYDHWREIRDVFATPMDPDDCVVNVVCAPLGMPLGTPGKKKREVVYRPATALAGLYTDGLRNIAITGVQRGQNAQEGEVAALRQYQIVCVPRACDQRALEALDVPCFFWAPRFLATLLKIMEDDTMHRDGTTHERH